MERKIKLRALEPEDIDALYEIENNMAEWESGATNVPFSRYALRDYIAHNSFDIYADRQLRQVITDETNAVLGLADIFNYEPRHQRAEVAVVVAKAFRCQNIATQALALIEDYARHILNLTQLYAYVSENNSASIHLFNKAGYLNTATLKSWLVTADGTENVLLFQLFLKKE